MGFELKHVLSDERHYGAFECAICQNLVDLTDALVTTACSHCFCRRCLFRWLDRRKEEDEEQEQQRSSGVVVPKCPTCNRDLLYSHNVRSASKYDSMMIGRHNVTVQPLSSCQPLAHRVLKRIQVSCPLRQHGVRCDWKGDYGDLQDHLLSKTAHTSSHRGGAESKEESMFQRQEQAVADKVAMAKSFKEQANGQFSSQHFPEARDLYGKALSVLEGSRPGRQPGSSQNSAPGTYDGNNDVDDEVTVLLSTLYSNRAAAHASLKDYGAAVDDASEAIRLNPAYLKPYLRKSRALVQMGEFRSACGAIEEGLSRMPEEAALSKELKAVRALEQRMKDGSEQLEGGEFALAKSTFGRLLRDSSPGAVNVLLGAAGADLGLGLTDSALRLSLQVLKKRPQSAEGYQLGGQCRVLMGDMESGIKLLKEAMRLDPDSTARRSVLKGCIKMHSHMTDAKGQVFHRQFREAANGLTKAISACPFPLPPKAPLYAALHTDRARALLRLKRYDEVLKDCALVLYARDDVVEAWLLRFQALHGLDRHEEALADATDLMNKLGSTHDDRIRRAYDAADFEVRKTKRPDFYKMLNLPSSSMASEREIKKAYRQKALELHPDRFAGPGYSDRRRREAEEQFQLLGEALEILTDDFKRQLYDEGYDAEAIKERVEAAQRAAHRRGH